MSKRKLWSEESMVAAVGYVNEGNSLRGASRLYNVPLETLRRRVLGIVDVTCNPGPCTVLTIEEEDRLVQYSLEMADRGFGLTPEDIRRLAYIIVSRSGRPHPFQNGMAGRAWMEGFRKRHHQITLRSPQSLSYCRAMMANKSTVEGFFAKLGALYGRLNLISKPMQIFNIDETGISIVHKPSKVICEVGRKHIYSITSAEKGHTHTVVSCVSASGVALPPLMIYPRKKAVPEKLKVGSLPGTIFRNSESGWITQDIYTDWFKYFLECIPPARPVLLIEDGHASHITIDVIELARANNIHLLCLPSHTSHILQPLDIGVFHSFKVNYSKACRSYLLSNPGRVVTTDVIAALVADAWPHSFSPVNILSGFKKSGIFPFNPGEVCDRMLAPSKSVCKQQPSPPMFSQEQINLYEKRYEEGYNIFDPEYNQWLKETHPESVLKSDGESLKTQLSSSDGRSADSSSISDILVLPEPKAETSQRKRKPGLNSKAICLSDLDTLQELKDKERKKIEAEEEKIRKNEERDEKRKQKLLEKEKKMAEREKKKKQRLKEKEKKMADKKKSEKKLMSISKSLPDELNQLQLSDDDVECPKCNLFVDCQWICCDNCNVWYHMHCTSLSPNDIPDEFYCENCL